MNPMNTKYRPCPSCTYPLREVRLDDKTRVMMCTNKQCGYERKSKVRRKR